MMYKIENNLAQTFANNRPPGASLKGFNISVLQMTWDAVKPDMLYSAGGFDPSIIKKTKLGPYYHLSFELAPGQKFGFVHPIGSPGYAIVQKNP